MPEKKTSWIKYAIVAAVLVAAYFIYVEVQTRLGERVLAEMQLQRNSLPEAFGKAKAENKLVLADLSAIWCPTCRSIDKKIFSNPVVQKKIEEKYVFARIEYESEEGKRFQETYDTRVFPTLLVLDPDGKKLDELPVTTDPETFIQFL